VKKRRGTDQCCHHKLKHTNKLAIVFSHVQIHQLCAKPRMKVETHYKSMNVTTRLFHKAENTTAAKSSEKSLMYVEYHKHSMFEEMVLSNNHKKNEGWQSELQHKLFRLKQYLVKRTSNRKTFKTEVVDPKWIYILRRTIFGPQ
jgi:hypothetical protein